MEDLTDATQFELVEATYYDRIGGERYERDKLGSVSIDRWSKYGHDRLYLNGLKTGDGYLDLATGESDGDRWTKVEAAGQLNGDELTIKVGNMGTSYKDFDELDACYELVVRVDTIETDDEPEVVADGGEDQSAFVDDETIETAMDDEDAHDHLDVETVRAVLADVQRGAVHTWGALLDRVKDGDVQLLSAGGVYVFATPAGGELDAGIEHSPTYKRLDDADQSLARRVVRLVHHDLADQHASHTWGYSDPLVVGDAGLDTGDGLELAEQYINGLVARGATPGQAWSYWGVEIRGRTQSEWARRVDRDQSTVSEQVGKIGADELGY
jgi:hypothetical protein